MATIQKRTNAEGESSFHVRIRLRGHPTQTSTFSRLTDVYHNKDGILRAAKKLLLESS